MSDYRDKVHQRLVGNGWLYIPSPPLERRNQYTKTIDGDKYRIIYDYFDPYRNNYTVWDDTPHFLEYISYTKCYVIGLIKIYKTDRGILNWLETNDPITSEETL